MRTISYFIAVSALSIYGLDLVLAETPLEWTNLRLKTQQGGNAEIELTRSFDGILLVAKVRVHNNAVPIRVPTSCWPTQQSIYYDNVLVTNGYFPNGREYWKFSFNVDEPASANETARFYLVVYANAFRSSYIEYLDPKGGVVRNSVCDAES